MDDSSFAPSEEDRSSELISDNSDQEVEVEGEEEEDEEGEEEEDEEGKDGKKARIEVSIKDLAGYTSI